jgi:parvulin-like peptidyl-prolyl isomerase
VPVKAGQKELSDAEALAKAQSIRTRIQGGEAFDKVAASESDDTGSGSAGGDLGNFKHGQMVADFEKAAFALNVGELSQPVKTPFGYHIIKVESKQTASFDDVKAALQQQLKPQRAQQAVDELVKNAKVVLDPSFFKSQTPPATAAPAAPPAK